MKPVPLIPTTLDVSDLYLHDVAPTEAVNAINSGAPKPAPVATTRPHILTKRHTRWARRSAH